MEGRHELEIRNSSVYSVVYTFFNLWSFEGNRNISINQKNIQVYTRFSTCGFIPENTVRFVWLPLPVFKVTVENLLFETHQSCPPSFF